MPQSFDFIVNEQTDTLIIGSMPGIKSLDAHEYYAHKQNLFWRFVFEAFRENFDNPSYAQKTTLLLQHHCGLWDAAQSCIRQGSLDTNIKNVKPNDFKILFELYPNIKRLLFNGQKAFQLFYRFNKYLLKNKEYIILPSTSPANASIPLEKRRKLWLTALLYSEIG
jgi:hypoxanthine-DNA glycosylase